MQLPIQMFCRTMLCTKLLSGQELTDSLFTRLTNSQSRSCLACAIPKGTCTEFCSLFDCKSNFVCSFCSFVRQLNGYGFSKKDPKRAYFQHDSLSKRESSKFARVSSATLHLLAESAESIGSIRRRKTTKRRSDAPQESFKHAAVASAGSDAAQSERSAASSTRAHHPVHHVAGAGQSAQQSSNAPFSHEHGRRAGHEGEQRPLLLSTLITLKQIVSAALSARAFGHSGSESGLGSLLLTTVQHSVASLLQSHRPDLLPSMMGPSPRLAVLDVALGQLMMQVSGGEDPDHMVSTATHGPAARSLMDVARHSMSGPSVGAVAAAQPPPQPTFASPAPQDMQPPLHTAQVVSPPQMQQQLPPHSTSLTTAHTAASTSHASYVSGDAADAASVSTRGLPTQAASTPPAEGAWAQQQIAPRSHEGGQYLKQAGPHTVQSQEVGQQWANAGGQGFRHSSPGGRLQPYTMHEQHKALLQAHKSFDDYGDQSFAQPFAEELDLSAFPDEEAIRQGRENLDAALMAVSEGPDSSS